MSEEEKLSIGILKLDIPQILETTILSGIVFILTLPLIGDYGLWLFPIGRDVIFKLTVELLWVLFLLLWSLKNWKLIENCKIAKLQNLKSPIVLSLLLFWTIMLLATLNSVQPDFSLWGNMYKNQGLVTWAHYLLFFFMLVSFVRNENLWRTLINISIAVASLVGLMAIWQVMISGLDFRASATLNNSNYLAAYLILLLPVTFAFFMRNRSLMLGSAAALQGLALIATQTRGGYLGVAIASFIFMYLFLTTKQSGVAVIPKFLISNFKFLILLPFVLPAAYYFLLTTGNSQAFQQKLPDFTDRFLNYRNIKSDSGPRIEAWQAGWHGILEKPLFGYGPENFFVAYDSFYTGSQDTELVYPDLSPWEGWFDKAHNFIFDIGATLGFPGLIAYIAIFASALFMLSRRLSIVKIGLIAGFSGYLAQNLLGFDTLVPGIYLMFLLAYTHFISMPNARYQMSNQVQMTKIQKTKFLTFRFWIFFVIWILAFVIFIFSFNLHANMLRANHQLNLSEKLVQKGRVDDGFAALEKGLEYNSIPINPNLRRRYGVIALAYYDAVEKNCATELINEQCSELYIDVEKRLARALELQKENAANEWPRFTRNYIYAAQIYNILGDYEQSDVFFEKALELSPSRTSINTEWERLSNKR